MNGIVYLLNGKQVSREQFLIGAHQNWIGNVPMTTRTYRDHDPLISEGLGCMRAQVPEMREVIRKHNIKGVRVLDSGQLAITSRRGRKELMRVRGLADADAGYGDI